MFRTPPRRERNGLILLSSFYFLRQSRYHSGNTYNCQHSSCICFVSGLNRHSFLRDFAVIVLIYGIFLLEYLSYFFCLFSRFFISFCLGSCFLRFLFRQILIIGCLGNCQLCKCSHIFQFCLSICFFTFRRFLLCRVISFLQQGFSALGIFYFRNLII